MKAKIETSPCVYADPLSENVPVSAFRPFYTEQHEVSFWPLASILLLLFPVRRTLYWRLWLAVVLGFPEF